MAAFVRWTAASGILVTDTLPSSVSFLSASTTRSETCPAPSGARFQCALAPLNPGARVDVNIRVQAGSNALGAISNSAQVAATQTDADNTNNNAPRQQPAQQQPAGQGRTPGSGQ